MKTLFKIEVKVTRPYATMQDDDIKRDFAPLFAETIKQMIESELSNVTLDGKIIGLNVEVKVK